MSQRRLNNFIILFLVPLGLDVLLDLVVVIFSSSFVAPEFIPKEDLLFVLIALIFALRALDFKLEAIFLLLVKLIQVFFSVAHVVALVPILVLFILVKVIIEA